MGLAGASRRHSKALPLGEQAISVAVLWKIRLPVFPYRSPELGADICFEGVKTLLG